MIWIKEVIRRLALFYVVLFGCIGLSRASKNYMLSQGVELHIAGPISMFVFVFIMIWTTGQLKFERIQ